MLTVSMIFFPLAAALVLLITPARVARAIALAAAFFNFILSLFVAFQYDVSARQPFEVNVPWITSMGANFHVGLDGISLILVLLTTLLTPFIILSSADRPYENSSSFYALILTMETALIGVFTALDGFLFYIFWEAALIPIYFICLRWGGENRGAITLKFFIYTLAGSLLMLAALIYVYFHTSYIGNGPLSFDIHMLYQAARQMLPAEQSAIFWAMFLAFAIKIPVFPFHTWQPDTYNTAPSQGTMLLSGIMLKMGVYGVIRWLIPMVPEGVHAWGLTAMILSIIGILYASCIAIVQKDLKRLIAYSSIAHVGLIAAGIFTLDKAGMQGAMVQMISHGIVIVALFFLIDIIMIRTGTQTIQQLGGIRTVAPKFTSVFVIVMLGSIALPMTSGFVGEFLLISSIFRFSYVLGALASITVILGAVYMLRSFQATMLGEKKIQTENFADLSFREQAVLYPLALLIILIGVYPSPLLLLSETAVDEILKIVSNYQALNR